MSLLPSQRKQLFEALSNSDLPMDRIVEDLNRGSIKIKESPFYFNLAITKPKVIRSSEDNEPRWLVSMSPGDRGIDSEFEVHYFNQITQAAQVWARTVRAELEIEDPWQNLQSVCGVEFETKDTPLSDAEQKLALCWLEEAEGRLLEAANSNHEEIKQLFKELKDPEKIISKKWFISQAASALFGLAFTGIVTAGVVKTALLSLQKFAVDSLGFVANEATKLLP